MKFRQVSICLARADAEHAEALLTLAGTLALTFDDAQDSPLFEPEPGATPLWPHLKIHALFPAEFDVAMLAYVLNDALPSATSIESAFVDDDDWHRGLEQTVFVRQIAPNLTVVPAQWAGEATAALVRLNMGLAFGTGRHPTTLSCLQWLAENPPQGLEVCDFGCGSGILAIAALQLGATRAIAIDNEPQAVAATLENAKLNALDARVTAGPIEEFEQVQVDLVLANILAGTLSESVDLIASMLRPRGQIVLSGILADQSEGLMEHFAAHFDSLAATRHDGWARITGVLR
jgi:ribosomal protein L11 methyltransferase